MGVYIKGMEMPHEGFVEVLIRDDGTVQQTGKSYQIDGTDYYTPYVGEMPVMYEAVPVPPHGRLIDADKEMARVQKLYDNAIEKDPDMGCVNVYEGEIAVLQLAPTIIEAEEASDG